MSAQESFFEALKRGDREEVARRLADAPELAAARSAAGPSAILTCLYHRQAALLPLLLERDPPLDVFEAAAVGDVDALRRRLDEDGARARAAAPDGVTPLHLAAFFDRVEAGRLLLELGADVEAVAPGLGGVRPLHSAVAGRSEVLAAALLEAGAMPDVPQAGGFTPLHAAALHGLATTAHALVRHGADPSRRADDGRDARAMARESGDDDTLRAVGVEDPA